MIEPRNRNRWSLRASHSVDNTGAPNSQSESGDRSGANVRPGSENQAEQYWGLTGRWESLAFPWRITRTGETGLPTSLSNVAVVPAVEPENARTTKVSSGKGDRATEMNEGSLSLHIVALERRGTDPMDPLIS